MFLSVRMWAGVGFLLLRVLPIQAESLSRDGAIKLALEHNPAVIAARAEWRIEQARALQTWAPPRPVLELEYEGMSGALDFGEFEQRSVGITQRLGFPAKWWLRNKAARLKAEAVRLSIFQTTRLNVVRSIRVSYDRILADERILRLAEAHVLLSNGLLERARRRFTVGDVPELDVMRAEVALGRLENQLTSAQNAVLKSRTLLNTLMGQMPGAFPELTDSLSHEAAALGPEVGLSERALNQRSDLRASSRALASANAAKNASLMAWVPNLSIGIARQTTNGSSGPLRAWRTQIAIELPLWAVADQRGEFAEESARYSQAAAEQERIRLRVMQEVNTAFLTCQASSKRMARMQERILPAAAATYEMARRSYDAGKATYLDLLQAQRDLIETSIEHVETLFEHNAARTELLYVTGEVPFFEE